eukprot:4152702-Pyramimonas_sp.AAC.1
MSDGGVRQTRGHSEGQVGPVPRHIRFHRALHERRQQGTLSEAGALQGRGRGHRGRRRIRRGVAGRGGRDLA